MRNRYSNGVVIIVNVVTASVLQRLGGHVDEVQALSWSINIAGYEKESAQNEEASSK